MNGKIKALESQKLLKWVIEVLGMVCPRDVFTHKEQIVIYTLFS